MTIVVAGVAVVHPRLLAVVRSGCRLFVARSLALGRGVRGGFPMKSLPGAVLGPPWPGRTVGARPWDQCNSSSASVGSPAAPVALVAAVAVDLGRTRGVVRPGAQRSRATPAPRRPASGKAA